MTDRRRRDRQQKLSPVAPSKADPSAIVMAWALSASLLMTLALV